MSRVLLYSTYVIIFCVLLSCHSQHDEEVTLNQIFGIQDTRRSYTYRPSRTSKTKILDIHTLTEEQLDKNFKLIEKEYKDTEQEKFIRENYNNLNDSFYNVTMQNNTRRFWLTYNPFWTMWVLGVSFGNYPNYDWNRANIYMQSMKATDNVLTLIYMARYKIKEIERHPLYNNKTPAFKIAFLYIRLRNLRRRIRSQWSRMESGYWWVYYQYWYQWVWERDKQHRRFYNVNIMMSNHQAVVAVHTMFTYYWWVLVRLHEQICNASHIYMTKPTTSTTPPPADE